MAGDFKSERRFGLTYASRLSLFLVSYIPLFLILVIQQVFRYHNYLFWGGMNVDAVITYIKYFGAISLFTFLGILGAFGIILLIRNVSQRAEYSGEVIKVIDIENKNSESISYLFTYLIPFVFQDMSDVVSFISVVILLIVTYLIYTNSSMLLINPTINMLYSLYQVEYVEISTNRQKKGMLLSRDKFLEENDKIKIKKIAHRLFYSIKIGGDL